MGAIIPEVTMDAAQFTELLQTVTYYGDALAGVMLAVVFAVTWRG